MWAKPPLSFNPIDVPAFKTELLNLPCSGGFPWLCCRLCDKKTSSVFVFIFSHRLEIWNLFLFFSYRLTMWRMPRGHHLVVVLSFWTLENYVLYPSNLAHLSSSTHFFLYKFAEFLKPPLLHIATWWKGSPRSHYHLSDSLAEHTCLLLGSLQNV